MNDVSQEFARLIVALAEAYMATKLREGTIRMYFEGLRDLPLPAVEAAMIRAVKECVFFPSIAELRRMIEPSQDDQALLAWTAFQEAASVIGAYASVEVEDQHAAQALRVVFGGWIGYCSADGPAVYARRAEFLAAYRESKRTKTIAVAGVTLLPGLTALGTGRITKHWRVLPVQALRQIKAGSINRLIGDGTS